MTDVGTCPYCDRAMDMSGGLLQRTKDHILPKALGGSNGALNQIPACRECNSAKAAHTPASLRVVAAELRDRAAYLEQIAERVEGLLDRRRSMAA